MRKDNPALRRGAVEPLWSTEVAGARRDAGILAFARVSDEQTAIVVINTSDQESETCAPEDEGGACMETALGSGTTLTDVAGSGETVTVGAGGELQVTVPPKSVMVLVN
jgi:hypothetical protein